MKTIHATVEKTNDGFSGFIQLEDGVIASVGENLDALRTNLNEGFQLHIEEMKASVNTIKILQRTTIEISLDLKQIFKFYKTINQTEFASFIGINRALLSQYINGSKHLSEKQSLKILNGIERLGRDYISVAQNSIS